MMACHHDTTTPIVSTEQDTIPEGMVEIEFVANTPLMTEVDVRGVDPDGIDVQNLMLFCFNDYGLYITHVSLPFLKLTASTIPPATGIAKNLTQDSAE